VLSGEENGGKEGGGGRERRNIDAVPKRHSTARRVGS
jgi:hypothetical protein